MRVTFLGAAREVTGSCFLVELEAGTLLIDCGLHQGRREESRRRNRDLDPSTIGADAAVLTPRTSITRATCRRW
jgi:metallo-beta-lactamase family protein